MFDRFKAKMAAGSLIEYEKKFCEKYVGLFEEYKNAIEGSEQYINYQRDKSRLYSASELENDRIKKAKLTNELNQLINSLNSIIENLQRQPLYVKGYSSIKNHLNSELIANQTWCESLGVIVPRIGRYLTYQQYETNYYKIKARIIQIETILGKNIYYK